MNRHFINFSSFTCLFIVSSPRLLTALHPVPNESRKLPLMEVVLRWTISRSTHEEMSQQPDSTVHPAGPGGLKNRTAPAANSVHDSSASVITADSVFFNTTADFINEMGAGVSTSSRRDSPRCASLANAHLGTHISTARLFASSDTRDCSASAQHEVRFSF